MFLTHVQLEVKITFKKHLGRYLDFYLEINYFKDTNNGINRLLQAFKN